MKQIVIKFEPFVFRQTVFIKDEDSGEITQESIPQKELASYLSLEEDICKVHFFGNEKFANKIKTECISKYKFQDSLFCINC